MKLLRTPVPRFVLIVLMGLGILDLVRGFMHTVVLEFAAINIAGLDLTSSTAAEQLRLLGTFGISNWLTGLMMILIVLYAKHLSIIVMGLLPVVYGLSAIAMSFNTANYAPTTANWGGLSFMMVYLSVATITFIAGVLVMRKQSLS